MNSSPPYYSTFASLQEGDSDLATTTRRLSNETIRVNEEFQSVYSALKPEEMFDSSPDAPSNQWARVRKGYIQTSYGPLGILRPNLKPVLQVFYVAGKPNSEADSCASTVELVDIIVPMW
ncbi:hypothetical protein RSAG8_11075, partial [Rhizoctonia solani AG-8 WAC10335]